VLDTLQRRPVTDILEVDFATTDGDGEGGGDGVAAGHGGYGLLALDRQRISALNRRGVELFAERHSVSEVRPPRRASGSSVTLCKSQSTKLPEFKFRAVLDDGIREVRFERVLT
jgi:hypothetical protein